MTEFPFCPARQLSEYKGKGASAEVQFDCGKPFLDNPFSVINVTFKTTLRDGTERLSTKAILSVLV